MAESVGVPGSNLCAECCKPLRVSEYRYCKDCRHVLWDRAQPLARQEPKPEQLRLLPQDDGDESEG